MTHAQTYEDALFGFFEDDLITDILQVVKSGKEGTVYCCRAAPRTGRDLVAAKIYRPREHRTFRNDAVYQEGRWIEDRRLRRAVANKSRAGRVVQADSWVAHEYQTLHLLHGAGAAVPEPLARSGQALLMEYIGDAEGPAPLIQHAKLPLDAAEQLFCQLLQEIERWLAYGRIHADLSAFNILYWQNKLTVIDFPQAVDPETNPNAKNLLTRDIDHVCRFFARFGLCPDSEMIAADLWRRYLRREL